MHNATALHLLTDEQQPPVSFFPLVYKLTPSIVWDIPGSAVSLPAPCALLLNHPSWHQASDQYRKKFSKNDTPESGICLAVHYRICSFGPRHCYPSYRLDVLFSPPQFTSGCKNLLTKEMFQLESNFCMCHKTNKIGTQLILVLQFEKSDSKAKSKLLWPVLGTKCITLNAWSALNCRAMYR